MSRAKRLIVVLTVAAVIPVTLSTGGCGDRKSTRIQPQSQAQAAMRTDWPEAVREEQSRLMLPLKRNSMSSIEWARLDAVVTDELLQLLLARYRPDNPDHDIIELLLKQHETRARELALQSLTSESSDLRAGAASLLGELGEQRAVDPLMVALFDDPHVSDAAAAALDRLSPAWRTSETAKKMIPALLDAYREGRRDPSLAGGFDSEIQLDVRLMREGKRTLDMSDERQPDMDREEASRRIEKDSYREAARGALGN